MRARQVARHLEDCRRCGMAAETYAEIKRALRHSAGPVPGEAVERLRAFGERLAQGWEPPETEAPAEA